MKNRLDAKPQEQHHIRTPLFARRHDAPKPFQPAIAPITPSPLRHLSVQHHTANTLLSSIVRRRNIRIDKSKTLVLTVFL